ncbi:MAG: hypothetical protein PHU31_09615 [Anaerotignum sp.]|nr:hypothetical protein [Anaerotignum sp.]
MFSNDGVYKFSTPVAVSVSLGETVRGTIDSADAQLKGYTDYGYFDEYQLVLDASQPFAIEAVMDDGSQPKMLVKLDAGNYKGAGYTGYSYPLATGRFPASGFQTSSAQSIRVQIFSKTPGAYTAKFIGSLTGAAVNFSSETAVPPSVVIIDGSQPWSANLRPATFMELQQPGMGIP